MRTRKRTADIGYKIVLSDDSCNSRGHCNNEDTVHCSEQSNSLQTVSDGLSPVLKRKSHVSRALRTLSNTPVSKVMTKPVLCHNSAASPIIGHRKLPAHTDNLINITQKLLSMDCNKENEKVLKVKYNKRRALLFPLGNSNITEHARSEINNSQVQYDTFPKKISSKGKIVSDKENVLPPNEIRLPIRKSKRIKKETSSVVQPTQSGRTKKIVRKNLSEEEAENVGKDFSPMVYTAKSKRGKSEPGDDIVQENWTIEAARTRKRMNPEKSAIPIAKRVNIVSGKKNENAKKTASVQHRVENNLADRVSFTSPVNNKNANILTGRAKNRPIRKNQMVSPQSNLQEGKSKKPIINQKKRNTSNIALRKGTLASVNKSASRKVTANSDIIKSQFSRQKSSKSASTKSSAQTLSKSAVCPEVSQTSSKTPLNIPFPPTSKYAVTPSVAQSSDESLDMKVIHSEQQKQKLPIWAIAKCSTKISGKRKSLRVINKDVFEFKCDVSEDIGKKRRVVKPRKKERHKKIKPRTKLTLLTTGPNWEITFPSDKLNPVNTSTARKENESTVSKDCNVRSYGDSSGNSVSCNDRSDDSTRDSIVSEDNCDSIVSEDSCDSVVSEDNCDSVISEVHCDDFYSHDNDDVTEEFEFETASSFVASHQVTSKSVPMTSASVFPTPVISKHISKYIGGSSTPRAENVLSLTSSIESIDEQYPKTLKEDIAVCFGFENEQEVGESSLNLSPVRRSGLQSCLEVTGTSDVVDMENCPPNQPSRFSWGSLQPGKQSYISASNSSSVLVHGRSDFLSSLSSTIRSNKSTVSKCNLGKSVKSKKLKENNSDQMEVRKSNIQKQCVQPAICENEDSETEYANASVLFDSEEVTENQHITGQLESPAHKDPSTRSITHYLTKNTVQVSPEKSFSEPPRKSYDRSILEEVRRKFISEHTGAGSFTSESEDVGLEKINKRKKKLLKSNIALKKKKKKKKKKDATDLSLTVDDSSLSEKSSVRKGNISKKEQALQEWALNINSQFSEVEDCDLIID